MQKRQKIAVLVEWSRAYGRGILAGVADYVHAHGRWRIFHTERRLSDDAPGWFNDWQGDGIIARVENPHLLEMIRRKRLPTVELFRLDTADGFAKIVTDEPMVGRLAADHLIAQGLRRFAFCGLPGVKVSDARERYFVKYLETLGHEVSVYRQPHDAVASLSGSEDYSLLCEDSVAAWVRGLQKPVGLLACNDIRAHQILMACVERGIAVPEEVALVGVDNDQMVCELCQPPLTTIELNPQHAGYEAASILDQWITTGTPPDGLRLVGPKGLVVRQSTDTVPTSDHEVAAAVHFIREHACDGIHVTDVLRHVSISRSTLERRFTKALGRPPKAEIDRVRLDRVKQLLAVTDYPLAKIAELSGFRYVEGMCHLFRNTFGQTPGQYRKER
ncbi:MAG: XylR family transcriptional regulator [Planctomycetota bacterium]|nr:XylR family transcriptional regulator [Planctomycetota bacterium]